MAGTGLKGNRRALNQKLDATPADQIPVQWDTLKPLIVQWWESYKVWERQDTFNKAFSEQRMTVRSFSNRDTASEKTVAGGTTTAASHTANAGPEIQANPGAIDRSFRQEVGQRNRDRLAKTPGALPALRRAAQRSKRT